MNSLFRPIVFSTLVCGVSFWLTVDVQAQQQRQRPGRDPEQWRWNIPDEIPGFVHGTIRSESMNREVGYNVYLPPSYESQPQRRYPVVYYLHGASGSEQSANELGHVVKKMNRQGEIGDVIYVFPNGGHFSGYRDWDNANVKAETLIIRELIPHIDRTYRTIAAREGRALCGWSMGGGASVKFVFKYPDLFCAAATMSAAIGGGDRGGEDTAFVHSQRNADQVRGKTGLKMVVGEDDRLLQSHQRLLPHLDELKIEYDFQVIPDVGHNLGIVKEHAGKEIVLMLAKHYAPAR